MQNTDIAYLAGIIDGEGSIVIYKYQRPNTKKMDYGGFVCVGSTSQELILWLCKNVGGKWCNIKKSKETYKNCYRWSQYGKDALMTVMRVSPYLIVKRKHAELYIQFYASIMEHRDRQSGLNSTAVAEREYIIQEMRRLTGKEGKINA